MKRRSVRTPMKNWTVLKSPKKGFTVHVLANRRSMGPRKKKTHWMANFLLEAKGYQNAASWKNGSAFRLDERRDDLVGQKPNYTLYKPNLAWFLFIFCWKSSKFSGKKKTRKLSSHFLIRGKMVYQVCIRQTIKLTLFQTSIWHSLFSCCYFLFKMNDVKEFNQTTSFANVDSGFNESRA